MFILKNDYGNAYLQKANVYVNDYVLYNARVKYHYAYEQSNVCECEHDL